MSNELMNKQGIVKLLDMLEHFAGWVAIPKGKTLDYEEALEIYKKSILNDPSLSSIQKSIKIANCRKDLKHYINQNKVVKSAAVHLSHNATLVDVDIDWINLFLSYAENISSERMQAIWGKLLAEKVSGTPGINKKLLQIFSCIENEDILVFEKLCSMSFIQKKENEAYYPFIYFKKCPTYYQKLNIRRHHLSSLNQLGLIEYDIHGDFVLPKNVPPLYYGNKKIYLSSEKRISNGNVRFTQTGQTLFKITPPAIQEDFLSFCIEFWKQANISYELTDFI